MPRIHRLVAIAQHDQHRHTRDPTGDQPEHIHRRLVGPVHVLDNEDGRLASLQLVDQRCRDLVGDRLTGEPLGEPGPELTGEVVDRPQGPRREERIAGTSKHSRRTGVGSAEPVDQCRLAAAGLRGDEHHATVAPGDRRQRSVECGQLALTLHQLLDVHLRVGPQAHVSHRDL